VELELLEFTLELELRTFSEGGTLGRLLSRIRNIFSKIRKNHEILSQNLRNSHSNY
jgi:hypothetical protein